MTTLAAQTAYVGGTEIKEVRLGDKLVLAPNGDELWYKANEVPSLDLRFADNKNLVDATTGQNLVTFSRASGGTYVDSQGVIRTATTNLLLHSEDFSTAWAKDTNSTLTTNAAVAPNGSTTADKFAVGTSTFPQITQSVASPASSTHCVSIYAKPDGIDFIELRLRDPGATGNLIRVDVNLQTAETATFSSGNGIVASASATFVGGGWLRIFLTGTPNNAGTSTQALVILAKDLAGTVATSSNSNTTDGVLLWGAQLEQSSTVGEYIPTTSTINSAPRFDHNPSTGESLGLLVEEQRSNLLLRSEEFDNASWTKGASTTVTANYAVAPNGTTTADRVEMPSTVGTIINQSATVVSGLTYTFSVYARATATTSAFVIYLGTDTAPYTLTAEWRRYSISSTATSSSLIVGVDNGNNTVDFLIWGAQLEAGAFPTSYIKTEAATATRAADVASITGANFNSWYSQSQGTVYSDWSTASLGEQFPWTISNGLIEESLRVSTSVAAVSNNTRLVVLAGNSLQAGLVVGVYTPGSRRKTMLAFQLNNFIGVADGGAIVTDTSGTLPTVDRLSIGSNWAASGGFLGGHIRRLCYWPQVISGSASQSITQ